MNLSKKEAFVLIGFVVLYIFIRSINFEYFFNFSKDPAWFSWEALKIWQEKKLTLLGPHISVVYDGRMIFQSSITYYFQLIFLLLGNWDPLVSSYYFMLFTSLMIIPLFLGTKKLINQNAAYLIIIIYSLHPFYINYTRFFWNSVFQFVLIPPLFYLMAVFKKNKSLKIFSLIGFYLGLLLQFYYQFIIVIFGLLIFYLFNYKLKLKYYIFLLTFLIIGFLPIIIFDLRNNFYNVKTFIFFLENFNEVIQISQNHWYQLEHYALSLSFFLLFVFIYFFRKFIKSFVYITTFIILLIWSLTIFIPKPKQAFRMSANWNYLYERKASEIIMSQRLTNFNVVNLIYDTKATTQKYLLKKNRIDISEEDYKNNHYLFMISEFADLNNPAYEVKYFKPAKLLNSWSLNPYYNLYLYEKIK